jgi:hypothetical protein
VVPLNISAINTCRPYTYLIYVKGIERSKHSKNKVVVPKEVEEEEEGEEE